MEDWAVPLAVGAVSVVGAFLLMIPGRMMAPYVITALVITGVSGLLHGSLGPPVHNGVTRLNGFVGQWINPWTGVAITVILSMVVVGCTILWVYQRQFDLRTFGFAAAMPIAVTFVPGPIGGFLIGLIGIIPLVVTAIIKFLFGL